MCISIYPSLNLKVKQQQKTQHTPEFYLFLLPANVNKLYSGTDIFLFFLSFSIKLFLHDRWWNRFSNSISHINSGTNSLITIWLRILTINWIVYANDFAAKYVTLISWPKSRIWKYFCFFRFYDWKGANDYLSTS